ncbi:MULTISPECIES: putative holin-like toxin [Paenibacillus]
MTCRELDSNVNEVAFLQFGLSFPDALSLMFMFGMFILALYLH